MKYDFKSVLKTCVTKEFYNALKVNSLRKKSKIKRNKGKYFRLGNFLYQCHLSDKEVIDEKSEALNIQCQNTVNNFLDNCKHI